jgi:DNA-binding response OmpR family regulator
MMTKSFFLAEDEALIRMMLTDMIEEIGHRVAAEAGTIDKALSLASNGEFDVAILDVNLDGQQSFPIAEALARRGIAFLFATGYGTVGLPPGISGAPVLEKPFQLQDLQEALRAALEPQYR